MDFNAMPDILVPLMSTIAWLSVLRVVTPSAGVSASLLEDGSAKAFDG